MSTSRCTLELSLLSARRTPSGGRAAAFTLIEILVVATIIAILVAVLVPSLSKAQHQARRVKCQSNLRQLAGAWQQYLDANAGRFPRGFSITTGFGGKGSRTVLDTKAGPLRPLNRYLQLPHNVEKAEVFACPADRQRVGGPYGSAASYYDLNGTSYKTNRFLIGPAPPLPVSLLDPCGKVMDVINERLEDFNRTAISSESRLLLLGDFGWDDEWNITSTARVEWHDRPSSHNIGFMDGHADFIPIQKGMHVTSRYTVVPFRNLIPEISRCQKPARR